MNSQISEMKCLGWQSLLVIFLPVMLNNQNHIQARLKKADWLYIPLPHYNNAHLLPTLVGRSCCIISEFNPLITVIQF